MGKHIKSDDIQNEFDEFKWITQYSDKVYIQSVAEFLEELAPRISSLENDAFIVIAKSQHSQNNIVLGSNNGMRFAFNNLLVNNPELRTIIEDSLEAIKRRENYLNINNYVDFYLWDGSITSDAPEWFDKLISEERITFAGDEKSNIYIVLHNKPPLKYPWKSNIFVRSNEYVAIDSENNLYKFTVNHFNKYFLNQERTK